METKATLISWHRDYRSGKYQAVFETDRPPADDLNGVLRLTVKRWREKRSLDQNGYMWELIQKIAVCTDSTKSEVYEEFLREHGFLDSDENGYITITLRSDIDIDRLPGHWRTYATDNPEWRVCRKVRGTSEYDTKEMSYFLDRVIEQAEELGIETLPPDELEKIKSYERQRTG